MDINLSNDFIIDSWLKKQSSPPKSVRAALHCFIKIAGMGDVADIDFEPLVPPARKSLQKKRKAISAPAKEKDMVREKKESYAQPPSEDSQEDAGKISKEKTHEDNGAPAPDSALRKEESTSKEKSGAPNESAEASDGKEASDKELDESVDNLLGEYLNS